MSLSSVRLVSAISSERSLNWAKASSDMGRWKCSERSSRSQSCETVIFSLLLNEKRWGHACMQGNPCQLSFQNCTDDPFWTEQLAESLYASCQQESQTVPPPEWCSFNLIRWGDVLVVNFPNQMHPWNIIVIKKFVEHEYAVNLCVKNQWWTS